MSVAQQCWDTGKSGVECSCSMQSPPTLNAKLPDIPPACTTTDHSTIPFPTQGQDTFTKHVDASTRNLPNAKVIGLILGISCILFVLLFLIYYCLRKRREDTVNNVDEGGLGPGRGRLKLSPSNCSQKPLLHTSSAVSENPKSDLPQQLNGESVKMVDTSDNPKNTEIVYNTSFNGGDQVIPMIDDEEEDDDGVIARTVFNESSC